MHPCPGHYSGTLVNALMYHCKDQLSGINGGDAARNRPSDRSEYHRFPCGLQNGRRPPLFGRSSLKDHSITRKYRAIVHGNLKEEEGTVNAPIGRHPVDRKKMAVNERCGRNAVTHYRVLERFGSFTYLECRLETEEPIRSGFTWPASAIPCWGTTCTALPDAPSPA